MINVAVGFDQRQSVAFQVCAQSVWEKASLPVNIARLNLDVLPLTKRGLTQFTYSRFLTPYLFDYKGWALFLDSDILARGDIAELPKGDADLYFVLDERRRFEWPSVMWMNCEKLKCLTPDLITREKMFDQKWIIDNQIRVEYLGKSWNHLVGYDAMNPNAKIVHFTQGIPIWPQTEKCDFAQEWWDCWKRMNSSVSFNELMGPSVHIPYMKAVK